MSKHDKDYDTTVLRAAGNILAGNKEVQDRISVGIPATDKQIQAAVETGMRVRSLLRKLEAN